MSNAIEAPRLVSGALFVDDRGTLAAVNELDLQGLRRFYLVSNHAAGFVRAWHGHKNEDKWVIPVAGSAIVAAVQVDDWDSPSRDQEVHRHVLSAAAPAALFIPRGYANGFKTLDSAAALLFLSSSTLEESVGDDYRYDARYWDPWDVVER